MNNKILQRFIAGMMLTVFTYSNTALSALAIEQKKPDLRTNQETAIKLRADISVSSAPITLSLRDSDVKQVLRLFADKAGMNIVFNKDVSGQFTLDLVDVPLSSAFDLVLGITDLTYIIQDNTLIISSASAETNLGKQEMTMVPVKYLDASTVADFLNKNIFGMKKPGLSGSEIVSVNPMTNELLVFGTKNDVSIVKKIVERFDKKPQSTSIRIKHTTPEQMADLICNMLLPAASGSSSGSSTGGAASISGTMTGAASSSSGDSLELGGGEVACTISANSSGAISPMALQSLAVAYFTQLGTIGIMGGSDEQIEMIKEFIAQNDVKQPQAYLELSIIELNETGSKTFENSWQFISNNFSFNYNSGSTSIGNPYPIFFKGDSYPFVTDISSGPQYDVVRNPGPTALTYTMNYILENNKGRVVANPKILITNGQESTIDLTSDYIKTVTSQIVQSSLNATSQKTYDTADDNGIKVSITPFISPDGYVTLNIKPDYATIKEQVRETNPDTGEYDLVATLLQRRNLDLKNVRIKDGETLIIGGMIYEDEQKSVKKIPFLGDIPGIGALFRSTGTTKERLEMIIMITPRLLVDSEDVNYENAL